MSKTYGMAGWRGFQTCLLLAQHLKSSVELFLGDGSLVRLERNRARRLIVSQLDGWLDLDGRGKGERLVSLNLDPIQRGNFNEDRHNTGLANSLVVEIRHEASNHILFHGFRITFLQ